MTGAADDNLDHARAAHRAGRLAEAEAAYRAAIARQPADAAALHGLGVVCQQTGRPVEAVELLRRAVGVAPAWAGCRSSLAAVLGQQGRHAEAAELLREAARLEPVDAVIHNNLGVALENMGRPAEAAEAYRRAIALRPGYAEAHNHLGNALRAMGRLGEAEAAHREAIRLKPDYAQAYNNLAATLTGLGRAEEVVDCFRKLVELRASSAAAGSDLLLALHYPEGVGRREVFEEHVKWAERHARPLYATARPHEAAGPQRDQERRLRVGYVSPDFRDYPAARFFEPLLAGHDRAKFEVFCYSDVGRPDAVTVRLKAYGDASRNIAGIPDERVEQIVRRDRIDILVDLAGHMANPRLLLFARRPAPVQVSYIGYPDTTGLPTIDYRITDEWHDPFDCAQGRSFDCAQGRSFDCTQDRPFDCAQGRSFDSGTAVPAAELCSETQAGTPVPREAQDGPLDSGTAVPAVELCSKTQAGTPVPREAQDGPLDSGTAVPAVELCSETQAGTPVPREAQDGPLDSGTAVPAVELCSKTQAGTPVPREAQDGPLDSGTAVPAVELCSETQVGTPVPREAEGRCSTEPYYTERLVRLPHCCWSYAPGEDLPAVGVLPAEATGSITFGVMNRLVKVTPRMMALWGRILAAVPHSRLMVLVARGVEAEPSVRARFSDAGIDAGRLLLVPQRPRREYLELFNEVDVGLDTFPYAGMTTTCDAMWMGVPTVTLAGQTHVSRTGVSLLSAVGLPELIARTPEEYFRAAAALASDLPRLTALRAGLRERTARSALADGAGLAAAIEAVYRRMRRDWRGKAIRPGVVPAQPGQNGGRDA